LRINRRIRVPEVRVIGADGQQLGVMTTYQAQALAEESGLDLVEVSPKAMPPVCKVMDYGKFKYEQKKKTQEAKKNQTQQVVKEVKFRPKTDEHDFQTKVKHVLRFLDEGNKAKVSVFFRGREIMHSDRGLKMLNRVMECVSTKGQVEALPKLEGRSITMMIAPKS
jgi:translation initiation factor IF-3